MHVLFVDIVQSCLRKIFKMTCGYTTEEKEEVAINGPRKCKRKSSIQVDKRKEGSNQRMWNCGPMMLLAGWQLIQLVLVRSDHWHVKAITQCPVPPITEGRSSPRAQNVTHSYRNAQSFRRTGVSQGRPLNRHLPMNGLTMSKELCILIASCGLTQVAGVERKL